MCKRKSQLELGLCYVFIIIYSYFGQYIGINLQVFFHYRIDILVLKPFTTSVCLLKSVQNLIVHCQRPSVSILKGPNFLAQ